MSFFFPLQLAWLVLLVPVVLLYLRYGARRTSDASTLAVWRNALAQRTLWSRWRRTVSIAAACVPIVLVALALAGPELNALRSAPRSIAVIIDNTASMNATDLRPSRLGRAKREAHRLIHRLRTHETMAVLSADSFTHAHCGLTADRRVLQAALGQVQPTDGAGDLVLAIETAQRMLAGQASPTVVVLTDRDFTPAEKAVAGKQVVLQRFVGSASNLAITELAARPLSSGGPEHEIFVEVGNFSDAARQVKVEVGPTTGVQKTLEIDAPAGRRASRIERLTIREASLVTARIVDADDALAADNEASVIVLPTAKMRVSVDRASNTSTPLNMALASLTNVEAVDATERDADLNIFSGKTPAKIPPFPTLVIAPQNDSDLWQLAGTLELPEAATQIDHPLTAGVDLRRVAIDRAPKLKLSDEAQVLASTAAGDPLLAMVPRESGDVMVLAIDPNESDLALRADFPRLIANAIGMLGRYGDLGGGSWTTQDELLKAAPTIGTRLVSPSGETTEASDRPLVAGLVHAGVWRLEDDRGAAIAPVNLKSERESDMRAAMTSEWPARVPTPLLPDMGPLWRWLVGLAVVWLLGQWVFYQRQVID
jgi:hypothetical protein